MKKFKINLGIKKPFSTSDVGKGIANTIPPSKMRRVPKIKLGKNSIPKVAKLKF